MSVPPALPFPMKFMLALSCHQMHFASNVQTEEFNRLASSSERDVATSLPYLITFINLISENGALLKQQLAGDPEALNQVIFDLKLIKTKLKHPKIEQTVFTLLTRRNIKTLLSNLHDSGEENAPRTFIGQIRYIVRPASN